MFCKDGGLNENLVYIHNGMETIQVKEIPFAVTSKSSRRTGEQENRNLQRRDPRNVQKCLMNGKKNCRTAGENGSNVMAMEMTFTHTDLFKHKY